MAHKPRIILIAPPPINEHLQWLSDKSKGLEKVSRLAATTKSYADSAAEVGEKLGVPVVNLWKAFMAKAGFRADEWKTGEPLHGSLDIPQSEALKEFMYDGKCLAGAAEFC